MEGAGVEDFAPAAAAGPGDAVTEEEFAAAGQDGEDTADPMAAASKALAEEVADDTETGDEMLDGPY